MGTLGKSDNDRMRLRFDGTPKLYQTFKEAMIKRADAEGYPWALAGENVICSIFQAANAKVAKSKSAGAGSTRSSTGMISLDITTYDGESQGSTRNALRRPRKVRCHPEGTRRYARAP